MLDPAGRNMYRIIPYVKVILFIDLILNRMIDLKIGLLEIMNRITFYSLNGRNNHVQNI